MIEVEIIPKPAIEVELEQKSPIEVDILSSGPPQVTTIEVLVTDPTGDDVIVEDEQAYIRIPARFNGWRLLLVAGSLSTPSSSGLVTVQLRRVRSGVSDDMLSTPITLDANETDTTTAATPPVIDTNFDDVQTADQVAIDVDNAGVDAKGLLVEMSFSAR